MSELAAERARIARELHDGLAQDLAAIGYALDAEIGRSDTTQESRVELRAIRGRVSELNVTVRNEIFKLRSARTPSAQAQLLEAINELSIPVQITGELSDDIIGLTLSKVIQELLRNAKTHTALPSLTLVIANQEIVIRNFGVGVTTTNSDRFGIIGLRERLGEIGWSIEQAPDFSVTFLKMKR